MKLLALILSSLCSSSLAAQTVEFTWNSNQSNHADLAIESTAAYYSGQLRLSQVPQQGAVELWWQAPHQDARLLARTYQAEIPIYWHHPAQTGTLQLKTTGMLPVDAGTVSLQLHSHPISTAAPACENHQPQSLLLQRLQRALSKATSDQQRQYLLQKFWDRVAKQHTPISERLNAHQYRIVYLWRGAKNNVRLLGGPSNDHDWLQRLPDSDVWFKEYTVGKDYSGSYVFAVDIPNLGPSQPDGCAWQQGSESRMQRLASLSALRTDPFNPHYLIDPSIAAPTQRQESGLYLSPNMAKRAQASQASAPDSAPLHTHIFSSTSLRNQRRITVYTPPVPVDQHHPLPTLVFLDGEAYTESVNTPHLLNQLISTGQMAPVQAVFIHNPSASARSQELPPNAAYTHMMATELLPWLQEHLPYAMDSQHTFIIGSSYGGLAAANLGLSLPQHFSHVIALSGSFWWRPASDPSAPNNAIANRIANETPPPLHWFLSAGTYETGRDGKSDGILEQTKVLQAALLAQGQPVTIRVYDGGHSYAAWNIALQDALLTYLQPNRNLILKSK